MINVQSARNLLNSVSPEIRGHWEKKNNVSLAKNIARIEEIEQNRQKPRTRDRKLELFVIMIVITVCILLLSLLKNSVIEVKILMVFLVASIGFCYVRLKIDRASFQKESDEDAEQANLSASVSSFWDTILKVCHGNTLPKDKFIDEQYLKGFLISNIEIVLLNEAIFDSLRFNKSFSAVQVNERLDNLNTSRSDLSESWTIVNEKLGVRMNKRSLFNEVRKEMKIKYPGLSNYFKTEEGKKWEEGE